MSPHIRSFRYLKCTALLISTQSLKCDGSGSKPVHGRQAVVLLPGDSRYWRGERTPRWSHHRSRSSTVANFSDDRHYTLLHCIYMYGLLYGRR
ncbi:hypothetical protein K439DRAFT_613700 [Ramaria rubella]|nr:hypothetical protein K439DRAFT_613700 [Ramaria rubella]